MQALMRELIALYTGLLQLQGYPLPELRARMPTDVGVERRRRARVPS